MNLNDKYPPSERWRAVVNHEQGVLVSLAGPGTGKTYSLVRRVESLLDTSSVAADNVYYITFVRKIAKAFTEDLVSYYTDQQRIAPPVSASTLDSLACRLIRNRGSLIGLAGEQYFLDVADSEDWIANVALGDLLAILDSSASATVPQLRKAFDSLKARWRSLEDKAHNVPVHDAIRHAYERLSRAYTLLDWDEVVPLATRILGSPRPLPEWLERYQHLLIDEYQDFNPAEQRLLELLIERAKSTVIVGDDDQSLYSGRGADPSGIRRLWDDPGVDRVSFVESRRCPSAITRAANLFLTEMRPDPRLLLPIRDGGTVEIRGRKSAKAEIGFLAEYLRGCLTSLSPSSDPKEGVACLFPSKAVLRQYQKALSRADVPCRVRTASTEYDAERWVRIMLRLAKQQGQPFLQRLLLERYSDVKPRHRKQLAQVAVAGRSGVQESVRLIVAQRQWTGAAANSALEYLQSLDNLESRDPLRIAPEIQRALPTGICCDPATVDQFLETALDRDLEDAIDRAVVAVFDSPQADDIPKVELITMHGSKGLTRTHVVLPGLEQYWLPGNASGDRLEEMKRLFYVAITRSKDRLLITYPRTRAAGDSLNHRKPGCGEISSFASLISSCATSVTW